VAESLKSGAPRVIPLADPAATLVLGRALSKGLKAGDVIYLVGELGAGKTTLARGLIEAVAGTTDVLSPTYNIVQIYQTPEFELWHVDLYRLKAPEEAFELGLEDAFLAAVCLVEWPERLQDGLGQPGLIVRLAPDGAGGRTATLQAGPKWEDRVVAI
jgi:tRNA threonylcarbamoyladenosine biosynthesis protein TsaE